MVEITMAGPAKNALGTEMMTFLIERLRAAAGKPVLLTGAGDAFSAGLDLREVAGHDAVGMRKFIALLEECMTALFLYPGPTVALVNGHAIAGGCVLTVACDHRVVAANPRIKIGLNEVALGVRFPPRTLGIVRARIPRARETEILLGAGLHGPEAAARVGLVDEVAENAGEVARARLAALAAHPADAYTLTKHDLRGSAETLCAEAGHGGLLDEQVPVWTAPSLKAKIAAVLGR